MARVGCSGTEQAVYIAAMQIVTIVLFILPCLFLAAGLRSGLESKRQVVLSGWRWNCFLLAVAVAGITVVLFTVFNMSWLKCGGSPHGMDTSPGLWLSLQSYRLPMLGATLVLATLGKGKGRWLLLAVAPAIFFADTMVNVLQME
jgi:hypothetical protein